MSMTYMALCCKSWL